MAASIIRHWFSIWLPICIWFQVFRCVFKDIWKMKKYAFKITCCYNHSNGIQWQCMLIHHVRVWSKISFLFDKHFTSAISTFLSQLLTFFCNSYRSAFSVTYSMTSGTRKSANCCLNFLLIFSAFALSCKMKRAHEKIAKHCIIMTSTRYLSMNYLPSFLWKFSLANEPLQQLLFLNQS